MSDEEYNRHMNEFLAAYYGSGWENIRAYFDYIHELSNANNECFGIYNSPEQMFGDHAFAEKSDWLVEIFDNALAADGLTVEQEMHIKYLRTGCEYLRLGAIHQAEMSSGDYLRMQNMKMAIRNFYQSLFDLGQTKLSENQYVPTIGIKWDANIRTWINNTTIHWYSE